ncbi:MAG: helix-turn-helix domain-containing protein [Pseudomonadota bacterium]|nr:helix-turn-helix domain-containing protein [Pseudomonadota bacterium]
MIDESRLDAYRRIVEEETVQNDDVDDIARQIEELQRERRMRQEHGALMDAHHEARLDYGQAVETDPYSNLTEQEIAELDIPPDQIDFTALSQEQQVRYWSLLSPGEKLLMVRLHLNADREELAQRLQLPAKVLRHLEEDNFSSLPSAAVVRHYYRVYADELGIDPEQLIKQYELNTGQLQEQPAKQGGKIMSSLKQLNGKYTWISLAAIVAGIALITFAVQGSWMTPTPKEVVQPPVRTQGLSAVEQQQILNAVDQEADTGVTYGAQESQDNSVLNQAAGSTSTTVQP